MPGYHEEDQLIFVGKNTQTVLQTTEISYQAAPRRNSKWFIAEMFTLNVISCWFLGTIVNVIIFTVGFCESCHLSVVHKIWSGTDVFVFLV